MAAPLHLAQLRTSSELAPRIHLAGSLSKPPGLERLLRGLRSAFPSTSASFRRDFGKGTSPLSASAPLGSFYSIRCLSISASRASPASVKPYYVTTPIFYVNADPHIGHLHSSLVADVLARYHSLRRGGYSKYDTSGNPLTQEAILQHIQQSGRVDSILSTGTDEHGLKVQRVAEAAREDPKLLCDRISSRFKDLAEAGNVRYTRFIRTTEGSHWHAVHHLWKILANKGHIYKGSHEGWYAVSDEAFYPEGQVRQVTDSKTGEEYMISVETGSRVEWSSEENYKFKLSAFADDLLRWLESDPHAIRPVKRHVEVMAELKSGLSDLSVSRPSSRLSWGIPVPDDPAHSIYVWVDALTNYLTVTRYPWKDGSSSTGTASWPADVHVVGKDIIRFHAIYWPAFLLAAGLPLPKTILAHSHWTMNKTKMSKSRGNVANPFEAIQIFGLDTIRFFLMRVGGNFASDSDYSPLVMLEYRRKYLQGQLGNLLSRISAPKIQARLARFLDGDSTNEIHRLPASITAPLLDTKSREMIASLDTALIELPSKVDEYISNYEFAKALEIIVELTISQTNELLQHLEPWSPATPEEVVLEAVVMVSESLRITGSLLRSFMPQKMDELLDVLQVDEQRRMDWNRLVEVEEDGERLKASIRVRDAKAPKVKPLFPRLDVEVAA